MPSPITPTFNPNFSGVTLVVGEAFLVGLGFLELTNFFVTMGVFLE
jgi:hypothetical protein